MWRGYFQSLIVELAIQKELSIKQGVSLEAYTNYTNGIVQRATEINVTHQIW